MARGKDQPEGVSQAQELQHYVIRGRLDLSQVKNLDRSVPLRVAAVRDNRILQSEVIKLEGRKELTIDFDLEFHLPGRFRRPCGVHLFVGRGDIKAVEILGPESFRRWIPAQQLRPTAGHNPFTVDVGNLVIPDHIYRHWLFFCRRYTIRGRVVCRRWFYDPIEQQWVFVDEPVPGATVEAYDTDCWWWWCFRDFITTAVTDVNGNFEMRFFWCCRSWFPYHFPWVVDPDLLNRIREMLTRVKLPVPLPDPPPDPFLFQQYLQRLAGSAVPATQMAMAGQFASPVPAGDPPASALSLKALLPQAPDLEALHVWPWWPWRDCAPDVTFKVTQPCRGEVRVIYQESRAQTRWNIPQTLDVALEANDDACCLPTPPDPPCGDCLVFTWICATPVGIRVDNIGTSAGPPDLRGYAYPGSLDEPFGGNLNVLGEFGEEAQPILDFYRIQYHKDGMAPGTWIDADTIPGLLGTVTRSYWNWGTLAFSPPVDFGPSDFVGDGTRYYKTRYKYERDNPAAPGDGFIWDDPLTLCRLHTENLPEGDGLYTFRIVGFRQAGDGTLVDERVMPLCGIEDDEFPTPATVMLRIDNQNVPHAPSVPAHPCGGGTVHICTAEPDCDFVSVIKNEGGASPAPVNPCDIVAIADSDTVTIHFSVTVPATTTDGHLLAYEMTAHYGESALIQVINPADPGIAAPVADLTPHVGPTYDLALTQGLPGSIARPFWYGGNFKVTLSGSAFPVSCAYLLRLRAWKRTTNGCTSPYYFHWNVCEFSFCVTKP